MFTLSTPDYNSLNRNEHFWGGKAGQEGKVFKFQWFKNNFNNVNFLNLHLLIYLFKNIYEASGIERAMPICNDV